MRFIDNDDIREEVASCCRLFSEASFKQVADDWKQDLHREKAKVGDGGNKLRTYARFKIEIALEPYLIHVHDDRKHALLFKFRAGIAPLRIETGRYESTSSKQKGIPVCERTCLCCKQGNDRR